MEKKYFGSKFYSSRLNTILLLVLIILMVIALRYMFQNKEVYFPDSYKNSEEYAHTTALDVGKGNKLSNENRDQILGNKEDLVIFSIAPNSKVNGVVSYYGIVKGGYFF